MVENKPEWPSSMLKICLLILFLGVGVGACSYLNSKAGLQDDNIIEEAIEEGIRSRTGIHMDLTPFSSEKMP